ncbi:MAG: SAF domain-containing protein [Spirochaetaceae bacterium]|nr:SAF domain-containing protein [Spirochaetaceae bacterium]
MLYERMVARERHGTPVRIGLIGIGTFGSQIAGQIRHMPGMRLAVIADLRVEAAAAVLGAGADDEPLRASSADQVADAVAAGTPVVTADAGALIDSPVDIVIEATGLVEVGVRHAYRAILARKHLAMVTVEADVLVGYHLRRLAQAAGVIYSLAYGDEPALAAELCDWARTLGFRLVAAGKGTRFTQSFRKMNPDDVPGVYGFTGKDYNAQMFGSFLDGTKHSIEVVALANMTGLQPDVRGLHFPTADLREIPDVLASKEKGGILNREGVVEAVSAIHPDDTFVERSIRGGLFAVIDGPTREVNESLASYGDITGMIIGKRSGYAMIYRPQHFVGHEMPLGLARMAVLGDDVGAPTCRAAEVVAAAKRPLRAGETLDGEGGYTVYGMAERHDAARAENLVPMALTHGAVATADIAEDEMISFDNVEVPPSLSLSLWQVQEQQESQGADTARVRGRR